MIVFDLLVGMVMVNLCVFLVLGVSWFIVKDFLGNRLLVIFRLVRVFWLVFVMMIWYGILFLVW